MHAEKNPHDNNTVCLRPKYWPSNYDNYLHEFTAMSSARVGNIFSTTKHRCCCVNEGILNPKVSKSHQDLIALL